MRTPRSFLTQTLSQHPYGQAVSRILAAAVEAVEPEAAVRRAISRQGDALLAAGRSYRLQHFRQIRLLGLGKAAEAMTLPVVEMLADRAPRGLLISKHAPAQRLNAIEVQVGDHPLPGSHSLLAGEKALQLVQSLGEHDLLICLISGGGSALMSAPYPGMTPADLQDLTAQLLACGARVDEINILRRHLDQLKGGGLARLASQKGAHVLSLILSDVVGSPLEAIASGPTAPDPSSRADGLAVLDRYHLIGQVPAGIIRVLENAPETPKPGSAWFEQVQNVLVASNQLAAEAALSQAEIEGFSSSLLGCNWQGDARQVGRELASRLIAATQARPLCWIAGGETTVVLHGHGRGGRNQELALAAVRELSGFPDVMLVSLATDGEDGPTDAAGAVVTGETCLRGLATGLSPEPFLADNDAYSYFSALGDLLKPGPTGTNVNDLVFLFGFK